MILIITNDLDGIYSFRREVIDSLISSNYDIVISCPSNSSFDGYFENKGCRILHTNFQSRGMNPFKDMFLFLRYCKILISLKPKVVLSYTIKPNIYGGIACRLFNIPQIANITGLGDAIERGGVLKQLLINMYKLGVNYATCVFFQNSSNMHFCNINGIATKNAVLIPGSGVNVEFHNPKVYPSDDIIRFLFIARIIKSKGINEYLYVAKHIKEKYSNIEFQILGPCNVEYISIINQYSKEGVVSYLGTTTDVRPYIWNAHCIVLPSYHEGMSNVNLESQANGRPVITTNVPGCKETIIDNETGFLVMPKNNVDLELKIEKFINLSHLEKEKMGRVAREWVVNNFNRKIVIDAYLNEVRKLS